MRKQTCLIALALLASLSPLRAEEKLVGHWSFDVPEHPLQNSVDKPMPQ